LYKPLIIKNVEVHGIVPAMRAMRLPKGSAGDTVGDQVGKKDLELASRLVKAGDDHAKAIRGIVAWLEIDCQVGWLIEFETYRHGVECMSTCYDDKTEVLTDMGWRLFRKLSGHERFATLNTKNRNVEYQTATDYIHNFSEKMLKFKHKSLDLLVTPNHKMVITKQHSDKISLEEAQHWSRGWQIPDKFQYNGGKDSQFFTIKGMSKTWKTGRYYTPHTRTWDDQIFDMNDWLAFLGFYLSQGSTYKGNRNHNVHFTHKTDDKYANLFNNILNSMGLKWHSRHAPKSEGGCNVTTWTITNKPLFKYLEPFGKAKDKYIPRDIMNLPSKRLKILWEWLNAGDGTRDYTGKAGVHGFIRYCTVSNQLADDVHELSFKLGIPARKDKIQSNGKNNGVAYLINYRKRLGRRYQEDLCTVEYNKPVYCVTVPNGTLYVRRNGISVWCGNSSAMHGELKGLKGKELAEQKQKDLPEKVYTRILTISYQALRHMYKARRNHRHPDWQIFCDMIETLPYAGELICV
jgi:hypothetical protein